MNVDSTTPPVTAASEFVLAPGAGAKAAGSNAAAPGPQPAGPFASALPPRWEREARPEEAAREWAAAEWGFNELLSRVSEEGTLCDASSALEAREGEEDAEGEAQAIAVTEAAGGGLSWEAAIRMIVAPSPQWGVPDSAGGGEGSGGEGSDGEASTATLPPMAAQGGGRAMPAGPLTAPPRAGVEQTMPDGEQAAGEAHGRVAVASAVTTEWGAVAVPRGTGSGAGVRLEAKAAFDEGQADGTETHRREAEAAIGAAHAEVTPEGLREAGRGEQRREEGRAVEAGLTAGTAAEEREQEASQTGVAAPAAAVADEVFLVAGKQEAVAQTVGTAGPAQRAAARPARAAAAVERRDRLDDGAGEGGTDEHFGQRAPLERGQQKSRGRETAGQDGEGHGAAGREAEATRMASGQSAMTRPAEPGRAAVAAHPEGNFVQEHRRAEANAGEAPAGAERSHVREIAPAATPLAPRTVQVQVVGERGEDVRATISATAGGGVQVRLRAAGAELSQAMEQGAPVLRERLEQIQTPRAADSWDAAAWSAEAGSGVRAAAEGAGQFHAGQENAGRENAGRDGGAPGEDERREGHSGGEGRPRDAEADGEEFEAYFQAGGTR